MSSPFDLSRKVCVVTGALGLLGKEHSRALGRAGGQVVVSDLDQDRCDEEAATLTKLLADEAGGGAIAEPIGLSMDITDPASLDEAAGRLLERFGRIDVLVNNAAINDMFEDLQATAELSKFESYPLELFERSLKVNVTGMFLACQRLGREMASQPKQGSARGSIINIASTYGMVAPDQAIYRKPDGSQPFFKSPAYPTTKGAVLNFTRYLAAYWGSAGVRVNSLSPGGIANGQEDYFQNNYGARTPLGRMADKTEMGGAIVFLASEASSYMTGANLVVDGGWTAW